MSRTRLNPNLAKIHRSYTVEEIARLYGLHRNTVRSWLKGGGLAAIDCDRPVLVQGKVLRAFLEARRTSAKRPCPAGALYCFKCREPRPPALGMADFIVGKAGAGNLEPSARPADQPCIDARGSRLSRWFCPESRSVSWRQRRA